MLLTCCSSFLKSLWHSTPSWLHGGKHDVGEGQLTTSHDVTTEGFRRTSVLATTASVILLKQKKKQLPLWACLPSGCLHLYILLLFKDILPAFAWVSVCVSVCVGAHFSYLCGVVYCWASQVNDEVIYPMFPRGSQKHNYRLRLCSPPLLFFSLSLCRHFTGEGEIAWRVQITQEGRRKKTVSGHLTAETALHSLTNTLGA